VLSW